MNQVSLLATSLALALPLGLPAQQAQTVQVGSRPTFAFQRSPLNGLGTKSLADLQGKPTLIEFWGTR